MKDDIRVLIVDDDEKFLKAMAKTLEGRGCSVSLAKNTQKSLKALISQVHHIAFINCLLVSGQGIDLVHKIREILGDSLDIVLMSGVLTEKDINNMKLSNVQFLCRPVKTSDLNSILKKIQNKLAYGYSDNLFSKFFNTNVSEQNLLKFLFNIEKSNDAIFLLTLLKMLNTGEKGSVKFSFNKQFYHEIFFENNKIVNYISHDTKIFLEELVNKKYLDLKYKNKLLTVDPEELDHEIIAQCYTSPNHIAEVKESLFLKALNSIPNQTEIKMESKIFKTSNHFFQKDQKLLTEHILSLMEQVQPASLSHLFDSTTMENPIVFRDMNLFKNFESLGNRMSLNQLKSHKQFSNEKTFQLFVLRLLLTSQAHLEFASKRYSYLTNRFEALFNYCNGKDPKFIMDLLVQSELVGALPSAEALKKIHSNFLKFNHQDRFSYDLPKETEKSIDNVIRLFQVAYHDLTDPKAQIDLKEKAKKVQMQKEIRRSEDKKRAYHFLEKGKYEEASKVILNQNQETIATNSSWKQLYLWLVYKIKNDSQIKSDKTKQFFGDVVRETVDSENKGLYFYILGLHHAYFSRNKEAIANFQRVKLIDPSFRPVLSDLRDLLLKESKKSKSSIFSKLKDAFDKKAS